MSTKKFKLIIRIVGIVIILFMIVLFLALDINFLNQRVINKLPGKYSSSITTLFPADRVNIVAGKAWQIKQEPIYFTVRLPNLYDKVIVRILFKNNCCHSVKLGILQPNGDWNYKLATIDNKDFNNLEWQYLENEDFTLWQRNDDYGSWSEWLGDLPAINKIASYNFDIGQRFLMDDYQNYRNSVRRDLNIRGDYSFYVYLGGKLLNIDFKFNEVKNTDGSIGLYDMNDNKLMEQAITEDEFNFQVKDLREGAYKIKVTGQDLVTKFINTKHSQISFVNRFELSKFDGSLELLTNSTFLEIKALDFDGLQKILIDDEYIDINIVNKKFVINNLTGLSQIKLIKGDIIIFGNGFFSFNEADFFVPMNGKLEIIDSNQNYDYFIAQYNLPEKKGDSYLNEVVFDIAKAAIIKGKLRFIISAPGVSEVNPLLIEVIDVIYEKKSVPGNIWTEFINYLKYWYRFII